MSCTKDVGHEPAATPQAVAPEVPPLFPVPAIPQFNPLTKEGIDLGRRLYYDNILSTNGLACASCHLPEKSFSTPLFVTKNGTHISVPPHINLAWNGDYNWNGSEPVLDRLCLGDFGPDFFNTDMDLLVKKLKAHPLYPAMFANAFGVKDVAKISHDELQLKIVYAISQFLRTMVSSNSRFDKWIRRKIVFTPDELAGFDIFFSEKGDCFHCHGYPLMTSNLFVNNGLDAAPSGADAGRYMVTGNVQDIGRFSVPTLRNIALTAPYMHDGRFATLDEVIEFYNSGVQAAAPNLDPIMTKPFKAHGLGLTPLQKSQLLAFLNTLTDSTFITDTRFKRPVDH